MVSEMASLTPINEFLINWYYSYERLLQITGFTSKWGYRGKEIKKISGKRKSQDRKWWGREGKEMRVRERRGKGYGKEKGKGKTK